MLDFQIDYYESWDFAVEKGIKSISQDDAILRESYVKVIREKGRIHAVEFYKNLKSPDGSIIPKLLEQQRYYYNHQSLKAIEEVYKNERLFVFYRYKYNKEGKRISQEVFNHQRKRIKEWITQYDDEGKALCEECIENGKVSFTVQYTYNDEGKKVYEEHLPSDSKGGFLRIRYNEDGVKIREEDYVNQTPDGTWRYFNDEGKLIREENYSMGVAEGFWQYYNNEGLPFRRELYEKGKIILTWQYEFDDYGNEIAGELYQNNKRIKHWTN